MRIVWPKTRPVGNVSVDAALRAKLDRDLAAREREGRDRLTFTARVFADIHSRRHRWDPRRLGDRYIVRECQRLVRRSEAKASR